MANIEDILEQMRYHPAGVRFVDACKVVTSYFGEPRQNGTSHKVWKMPWAGDPRINMQRGKSGMAKTYQVRQAVQAIDRHAAEQAAAAKQAEDAKRGVAAQRAKPKTTKARRPKTKKRRS